MATGTLSGRRIAVVGATGVVGREVLSILEARGVPASRVTALAHRKSAVVRGSPRSTSRSAVSELSSVARTSACVLGADSASVSQVLPHVRGLACVRKVTEVIQRIHASGGVAGFAARARKARVAANGER